MSTIEALCLEVQEEAKREEFSIDEAIYHAKDMDPTEPVLFAGNLESKICIFARDLGRDEVHARQPLYGAAGRLVRNGIYQTIHGEIPTDNEQRADILKHVMLTNTVPYKPAGNKAYSAGVKKRFRPFLERLLVFHWEGDTIITLGTQAFKWFSPYGERGEVNSFFKDQEKYVETIEVTLKAKDSEGVEHTKKITLAALPHPSPLNQKYYKLFPQMLLDRLEQLADFS